MSPDQHPASSRAHEDEAADRVLYVVDEAALSRMRAREIDLVEAAGVLRARLPWILLFALITAAIGAAYSFLADTWFRSEVVLAPSEEQSTPNAIVGQLGGLASLAGISVGGGSQTEALAVLRSRDFIARFIEEEQLLPILFAEAWSTDRQAWIGEDADKHPDLRDGVAYFISDVVEVTREVETELVTLAIEWKEPELAAHWANRLAARINEQMRNRDRSNAERNIAFLREELATTDLQLLKQSIAGLLERELQTLMLARGTEEFAFKIIDPATVAKQPVWPKPPLVIVFSFLVGLLVSAFGFLVHAALRKRRLRA